jgi:DNA polymerase-3 subunit epsilon
VQHLGIRIDGDFHRAEADARFCGRLFAIMIERIFAGGAPVVLENLVNLSSGQPLKFPQVQRSHKQLDLFAGL